MIFNKSLQNWNINTIDWNSLDKQNIPKKIIHILSVTALLESRSSFYADYLIKCLAERKQWHQTIHIWESEEALHGKSLAQLFDILSSKDFSEIFRTYKNNVKYHEGAVNSVRGSIEGEMIARCVVEALASTYYRALSDSTPELSIKKLFRFLAEDEARHFGMFLSMKEKEPIDKCKNLFERLYLILERLIDLDDDQISYASYLIYFNPSDIYSRTQSKRRFQKELYSCFQFKDMRYLAKLLVSILKKERSVFIENTLSCSLYIVLKIRLLFLRF